MITKYKELLKLINDVNRAILNPLYFSKHHILTEMNLLPETDLVHHVSISGFQVSFDISTKILPMT